MFMGVEFIALQIVDDQRKQRHSEWFKFGILGSDDIKTHIFKELHEIFPGIFFHRYNI